MVCGGLPVRPSINNAWLPFCEGRPARRSSIPPTTGIARETPPSVGVLAGGNGGAGSLVSLVASVGAASGSGFALGFSGAAVESLLSTQVHPSPASRGPH